MDYSNFDKAHQLLHMIDEYGLMKCEYGCKDEVDGVLENLCSRMETILDTVKTIVPNTVMRCKEPDSLLEIKLRRTDGPRKIWKTINRDMMKEKVAGAILGRFAACMLGAPVEGWEIDRMEKKAKQLAMEFPPVRFWEEIEDPERLQYECSPRWMFARTKIDSVPVDDDISFVLVNLILLEKYGLDFTTYDVGSFWKQQLSVVCTAEAVALDNFKKGISIDRVAELNNPYVQWIGADIRADGFAYACAGWPEKAAELAYQDAYLSHRRNGIYGSMFFAATIAAAFTTDNAIDAIRIGLTEIPKESMLYQDVVWALKAGETVQDYKDARQLVDQRFPNMPLFHTNNNACLVVFGLMLGGNDYTKVISNIVAMGLDNDCTAATAGSIVGAIIGKKGIPSYWYDCFHDTVHTFMNDYPIFSIEDIVERYIQLAIKNYEK